MGFQFDVESLKALRRDQNLCFSISKHITCLTCRSSLTGDSCDSVGVFVFMISTLNLNIGYFNSLS